MLKQIQSPNAEDLAKALKNPHTDIVYQKTKNNPLKELEEALGKSKEEFYTDLNLEKSEWTKKLKNNDITLSDIITLSRIYGYAVKLGRATDSAMFVMFETESAKLDDIFLSSVKEYKKKINQMATKNGSKNLVANRCGSGVMKDISDDTLIKEAFSMNSNIQRLNDNLYGMSISFSYTPVESERISPNSPKSRLKPYQKQNWERIIAEDIERYLKSQKNAVDVFQIDQKKDAPPIEKQLSLKSYLQCAILAHGNTIGPEDGNPITVPVSARTPDELEKQCQKIAHEIIYTENKDLSFDTAEKELNVKPEELLLSENTGENLLKLLTVTGYKITFPDDAIKMTATLFAKESEIIDQLKEESITENAQTPETPASPAKEKSKTKSTSKKTSATKKNTHSGPIIKEENTDNPKEPQAPQKETAIDIMLREIKKQGELRQPKGFSDLLAPLVRLYYGLGIGKPFLYNGVGFKITETDGKESLVWLDEKIKASVAKEIDISNIILLLVSEPEKFSLPPFEPKDGDTYWTVDLATMIPIELVWGRSKLLDTVNKNYKIIFRSQKELERAGLEKICKSITG